MADAYRLDSVDSTRPGIRHSQDMSKKVLRWFAQTGAAVIKMTKYFLPTTYPASDGQRADRALEEAGALAAAPENVVANLTTPETSFTVPVAAGVKVDTDVPIDSAAFTRRQDTGNSRLAAPVAFSPIAEKIALLGATAFECPLWVKSGHQQSALGCPLCANSRHSALQ